MYRSGTGGGKAYSDFTRIFCMSACHEGSAFLMAHLNKFNKVVAVVKGFHDAVDAISGVAKNSFHAPFVQALYEVVANSCHRFFILKRVKNMPSKADGAERAGFSSIHTDFGLIHV